MLPALPRLLVVIDEFAEMKASLPEFMSGLVSVANTGRSLGVHLILATQRTGSAQSSDIAAAAGLRVSLRANSVEDSLAVLDAAARPRVYCRACLDEGMPAKASDDLEIFQGGQEFSARPASTWRSWW